MKYVLFVLKGINVLMFAFFLFLASFFVMLYVKDKVPLDQKLTCLNEAYSEIKSLSVIEPSTSDLKNLKYESCLDRLEWVSAK